MNISKYGLRDFPFGSASSFIAMKWRISKFYTCTNGLKASTGLHDCSSQTISEVINRFATDLNWP